MEEEIDLRQYVEILIRYWKWIAGLALVAAATAFVFGSLQSPTYEASAVVIITKPRYQMQFDPRFKTVDQWTPAYKAFPTLAISDEVLGNVLDAYTPSPDAQIEEWTLRKLSRMVEATSEGDPSLVVLRVRSGSPEDATAIANLWAGALVRRGNQIYSEREVDVVFFEAQVAQAEDALNETDAALVEFQARNQGAILEAQLASAQQDLQDYLIEQREIERAVRNARALQANIADQPVDGLVSPGDDLTALLLQLRAFSVRASRPEQTVSYDAELEAGPSVWLQISDATILSSERTSGELMIFLDGLVANLETRDEESKTQVAALEPQILTLQQQLQQINTENDRLTRARDLARETYLTLARKLEEARISAREENGVLQVGSHAAVPERPVGSRKLPNTAVAGALGLMLGVFGAFAVAWWQGEGTDQERKQEKKV